MVGNRKKKSPYTVLGINPYMTEDEAKSVYRGLCKKYHPDVTGDDTRFREIQSAWEELKKYGKSAFGKKRRVLTHKTLFTMTWRDL